MYGFEETEKYAFLIGQELQQVCIGLKQVILNFHNGSSILAQSKLVLQYPDSTKISFTGEQRIETSKLVDLLGLNIESLAVLEKRRLRFLFSNKYRLDLIDDSEQCESFSIVHGPDTYVV